MSRRTPLNEIKQVIFKPPANEGWGFFFTCMIILWLFPGIEQVDYVCREGFIRPIMKDDRRVE